MIGPTLRIARIFGIPVRVDLSWLLVFVLFVYLVTQNFFKPLFPDVDQGGRVGLAVLTIFLFFISVLLHELAHSLVAMAAGLKVKAIALFILGGVSQLEGEPKQPWVEFWMAFSGPLVSLLIGVACGALALEFGAGELASAVMGGRMTRTISASGAVLFWLAAQNILMFVFNMIPGFPLDGGRVVRAFVWGISRNYALATRVAAWFGRVAGYGFLGFGFYQILSGRLGGLWFLVVGIFLGASARVSFRQAAVREVLQGYEVGQFVQPVTLIVPGQLTLELVVQEYFVRHNLSLYPVRVGDAIEGVLTPALVHKVPRHEWERRRVSEAMAPLGPEYVVGPHLSAQEAFERMTTNQTGSVLVMEEGELLGMVSQREMLRLVRAQPPLRASGGGSVPPTAPPVPPLASRASGPLGDVPADPTDRYERFGP
ncbi:MAG TPA: site-2 protease family protein [Ktedonobacterales bacterium]